MTSVQEAKNLIAQHARPLPAQVQALLEAQGCVLTEAVVSAVDMPPFDQSAMDGYAFAFDPQTLHQPFQVIGEIPAGSPALFHPQAGEALRIFTGAPLPPGTDTVVMQEKVTLQGKELLIEDPALKSGSNVRLRGSQTRAGALALDAGALLTPGAIGFLAGLGVTHVSVRARPKVALLITGKELAPPGAALQAGQVYESNSFTLTAALKEWGITPELVFRSDDDETAITEYLRRGIEHCDLIIATGGISVGDYDLVKKSMENCGVESLFYKVKQKPGKPIFCGHKGPALLFGLPGNPGAVLTCFQEYIVPALRIMTGRAATGSHSIQCQLSAGFTKREGLTYFLKGRVEGSTVVPLDAQESYQMNSFALANALIVLEEDKTRYEKGDLVEVHPFGL